MREIFHRRIASDEDDIWPEIRETLRVEEVVDELGIKIDDVKGFENMASCPLPSHSGADARPSFSINLDKMVFNCFVCGGGNIPTLVAEIEGMSYDQAVNWLIPFSEYEAAGDLEFVEQITKILHRVPEQKAPRHPVLPWFPWRRLEPTLNNPTDTLMDKWHVTDHARAQLKIGYDENWQDFNSDYEGPCVLIPHIFKGSLVGYQQRWLDEGDGPEYEGIVRPKHIPKYKNTPDFPKKHTLFNYDMASKMCRLGPVFVVESAMTVARLLSAGYVAVATFGASINPEQMHLLRGFPHVIVSYDNDKAGKKATKQLASGLDGFSYVEVIPPPSEQKGDLGDLDLDLLEAQIQLAEPAFLLEN